MKESEQAIPVGSVEVLKIQKELEDTRSEVEKEIDEREYLFHDMALTHGWELLRDEMKKKIESYRGLKDVDVFSMNDAEIGLRFKIGRIVAEELQHIIDRIETAKETVSNEIEAAKSKKKKK